MLSRGCGMRRKPCATHNWQQEINNKYKQSNAKLMASLLWLAGCDQVFSGHVVKQYCKEYCKYIYACLYIQCTFNVRIYCTYV